MQLPMKFVPHNLRLKVIGLRNGRIRISLKYIRINIKVTCALVRVGIIHMLNPPK